MIIIDSSVGTREVSLLRPSDVLDARGLFANGLHDVRSEIIPIVNANDEHFFPIVQFDIDMQADISPLQVSSAVRDFWRGRAHMVDEAIGLSKGVLGWFAFAPQEELGGMSVVEALKLYGHDPAVADKAERSFFTGVTKWLVKQRAS